MATISASGGQPPDPGGGIYLKALEQFFENYYSRNKNQIDSDSDDKINYENILKLKNSANNVNICETIKNKSNSEQIELDMNEKMDLETNSNQENFIQQVETNSDKETQGQHTNISNTEQGWTPVNHRKKRKVIKPKGQTPVITNTQNMFQALETENNVTQEQPEKTEQKPPPIFVPNILNFQGLSDTLNTVAKDQYQCKIIGKDQVKVQSADVETFRKIVHLLHEKNTEFHTYQLKHERNYRVVIKNLHYSVDLDNLKVEIEEYGHKVSNIYNIKQRLTGKPLPIFFVDIQPATNNKDIYNIDFLCNTKITIESPRIKRDIVQCARCQRYGHTKAYCFRQPRCVKCGENHLTKTCKKDRDTNPICALCGGSHPANYKGCNVYKELQKKKYPPLRPRNIENTGKKEENIHVATLRPGVSYVQAAQHNNPQECHQIKEPQDNNNSTPQANKLEEMMSKLMVRMDTMLNLLTTIVSKIPQWSQ